MTTTIENSEFSMYFEYYKENCKNFKETFLSDDNYACWSERCGNFEKEEIYGSICTCWNCKRRKFD